MDDLDVENSVRHEPYAQGQGSHGVEKCLSRRLFSIIGDKQSQ